MNRPPDDVESTRRFILRAFVQYFLFPGLAATCALLGVLHFVVKPRQDLGQDRLAWISDASGLIAERYVAELDSDRLAWEAIKGMTASLDPYSDFVDPEDYARYREQAEGQYVGVGFVLYTEGAPVTVLYPFPGSPAEQAGLETGDRIVAVDGESCAGKRSDEIVEKIKNLPGTPVTLRVRKYGKPDPQDEVDLTIVRELIDTPSVFDAHLADPEQKCGYVRIADFHERTTDELIAALRALADQGMKSLVLDLRHNRGGLLTQAIQVASLFLKDCVVVRTEGRTEESKQVYRTEPVTRDGEIVAWHDLPLVVLVDATSASASEIVAGALQDHLRALLVGERTFGKGMVQTQIPRRYGGNGDDEIALLKITTSRYLTPSGKAIEARYGFSERQRGGLLPDVPAFLAAEEVREFEKHQRDREIAPSIWSLIDVRCKEHERALGGRFRDTQLERAIEVVNGAPLVQKLY
jgi:carboxyl-terminal processing protease